MKKILSFFLLTNLSLAFAAKIEHANSSQIKCQGETTLESHSVQVENGAEGSMVKIRGEVLLGSNSCHADGISAKFLAIHAFGGEVHIFATLSSSLDPDQGLGFCPAIYDPVMQSVEGEIPLKENINKIIMHNLGQMNNTESVWVLQK